MEKASQRHTSGENQTIYPQLMYKRPHRASFFQMALLLGAILWSIFLPGCRADQAKLISELTDTPVPPSVTVAIPTPTKTIIPSRTPVIPTQTEIPFTPTRSPTPTTQWPPETWLFPDSEIVYGPSSVDFNPDVYLDQTGGFLNTYRQYLMITSWTSGADIVSRVALENTINPRLLLVLLEFQSGSILGSVENPAEFQTAMGALNAPRQDLYGQLVWAVHHISEGYYGWRTGTLTEFSCSDGTIITPNPDMNAGTVAIQYFFAQLNDMAGVEEAIDPISGFPALYRRMFGDPWERAVLVEPLVPPNLEQPVLTLPFGPGKAWAYTGGPHPAFESSGPLAALDFAPPTAETGCYQSEDWVVAMTAGEVIRSELGVVIQDLDGDGLEQTGWVLLYLHIEDRHRVPVGTQLKTGDPIGHPSCEGGRATGTHVHIARKYNGEWIAADGPIPFTLDGWEAHNGESPYLGTLTRGDEIVTAHRFGSYISRIARDD